MSFNEGLSVLVSPLKEEIKEEAAKLLKAPGLPPLSFEEYRYYITSGDRLTFEKKYFDRRRQLVTLGLAYSVEGSQSLKTALENVIWEICNEYSWSLPAHFEYENNQFVPESDVNIDLFAAETGQTLSEMYEIFPDLSPEVRERIELEVDKRIFEPLLKREWRWEKMENNWSGVVAGCIGMSALSLFSPTSSRQQEIIKRLDHVFEVYLGSFAEDGACVEGIGYWAYGFGYYLYFAEKYAAIHQDDRYLSKPKLTEIAAFPNRSMIGKNQFVPFSDASEVELPTGLLSYCQEQFKVPMPTFEAANSLHFDHCYRWAHLYRNLIWTKEIPETLAFETHYFPDAQWVISRGVKDGFNFAAKAGNNAESHNHNDVGHFVIGTSSDLWLTDLGAGEYTKAYFEDETRYGLLTNRSLGHSVPVINGFEQRYGEYEAKEVVYEKTKDGLIFEMDLTETYPTEANLAHYTRHFFLNQAEETLTIEDEFHFKVAGLQTIDFNFISEGIPEIKGKQVVWTGQEGDLALTTFDTKELDFRKHYYKNHAGELSEVYVLTVHQTGEGKVTNTSLFSKK